MKILVTIFEQLVPTSGGGTPRIRSIIDVLVKRGHEVFVAASVIPDIKKAREALSCKMIYPLKNVSRLDKQKFTKYLIFHPYNISKVIREAIKLKPDIIIAHNALAGLADILAKKVARNISVIDMTDLLFEYLPSYSKQISWARHIQRIGGKIENKVISEADRIITISNSMKEVLVRKGAQRENVDVVYDGVNPDLFEPKKVEALAIRKKYAANAENVVMFHGVIDPQDNPEILVDASVDVLKDHPHTVFWLVGDGAAIPSIKEQARRKGVEENFFFSGWIPFEKVHNYISACDIGLVILPNTISARIRLTLKSFEYWACEKPIVAAELPALKEIVIPWQNGLFYEPEDPNDLADKISILLKEKKLGQEMGKAGRQLVKSKYNWSELATQFVSICEDLL